MKLYKQGDYAGAAREFEVAARIVPGSARLTFNLARALERAKVYDDAIAAYGRYLELAPEADDRASVEATIAALSDLAAQRKPELPVRSEPPGATVFLNAATSSAGSDCLKLSRHDGPIADLVWRGLQDANPVVARRRRT